MRCSETTTKKKIRARSGIAHHATSLLVVMFTEINVLGKAGGGAEEAALPHAVPMNRNRVHSRIYSGMRVMVQ